MDVRDTVTSITAVAVVGAGSVVGGGQVLDNMNDGPQKRREAEMTELQLMMYQFVIKRFLILESMVLVYLL